MDAQGRGRRVARRSPGARASVRDRGVPRGRAAQQSRRSRRLDRVKVFIVSDMEGVAGIVRWQQTSGGHAMYEEGRRLYTGEINAAVRGAKAAGATEIVVMDCHGAGEGRTFNSLIPDELDPACEFVVQNEWTEYTEFLEGGVDAALFVAMHAMAGTRDGVLAHTVSGSSWWRLRFNGVEGGETGINAALCGAWGCPVLLVTGDEASCREGRALLGDGLTTVAGETGPGRLSARQYPASQARGPCAPRRRPHDGGGEDGPRPLQRPSVPGVEGARADRGGGTRCARRSRRGSPVRPGLAVRDRRRLQHVGPRREVPLPRGRRDLRAAPDRLPRRRLVDGVEAVLLLSRRAYRRRLSR